MIILVTIRKSQVKDYVTKEELDKIRDVILGIDTTSMQIDCGYHIHGKYRQLHYHGLWRVTNTPLVTWLDGFRIYYSIVKDFNKDMDKIHRYLHSDDHYNQYKLEEILIRNDANHHYLFV